MKIKISNGKWHQLRAIKKWEEKVKGRNRELREEQHRTVKFYNLLGKTVKELH